MQRRTLLKSFAALLVPTAKPTSDLVPVLLKTGEKVIPMGAVPAAMVGSTETVVITLNGKQIAEAIVPHIGSLIRR